MVRRRSGALGSSVVDAVRSMSRVVVVAKRTRYEFASQKFGGVSGTALDKLLVARGMPLERIKSAHHSHLDAMGTIVRGLFRRGCDVSVVRAPTLLASDLDKADVVFTAGGDGTVLETAARIKWSDLPVLSINTDPKLSTGFLCTFAMQSGESFEAGVLDKLKAGHCSGMLRTRIQVDFRQAKETSPHLALNEVLFAERDASRPTVMHATYPSLGRPEGAVQRSSGLIVSTGTGSTAWTHSAATVHRGDIVRVLDALSAELKAMPEQGQAQGQGQACPANAEVLDRVRDLGLSQDAIDRVCVKVNEDCNFAPADRRLQYYLREAVLNGWYGEHDSLLSAWPNRGFEENLAVRSLAWDGVLTFDGIEQQAVPYGETMDISAAPPERSLLTVALHDD